MKGLWLEPWKDVTFLSEYTKGIKWIYEKCWRRNELSPIPSVYLYAYLRYFPVKLLIMTHPRYTLIHAISAILCFTGFPFFREKNSSLNVVGMWPVMNSIHSERQQGSQYIIFDLLFLYSFFFSWSKCSKKDKKKKRHMIIIWFSSHCKTILFFQWSHPGTSEK